MPDLARLARGALRRIGRGARRLAGIGRDAPVILMYHRVATLPFDPWGLAVEPGHFREQLAALKSARVPMAMDDLVEALAAGTVPPRATALTFDDGYADNAHTAKPLLEEAQVPATFFLTSGPVASGAPFWWDELAAWVLGGTRAADFEITVAGTTLAASWGAQPALPADLAAWRVGQGTRDPRRTGYVRLWTALQRLPEADRALAMAALRERFTDEPLHIEPADHAPITPATARGLGSRWVAIGGHGRNHVPLPALAPAESAHDIRAGRADIAALTGVEPRGFAYPHGEWNDTVRQQVIDAGFAWSVGTDPRKIDAARHDRYALPRIEAGNWPAARLLRAIGAA